MNQNMQVFRGWVRQMGTCAQQQPKVEPSRFHSRQKVKKQASEIAISANCWRCWGIVILWVRLSQRPKQITFLVLPTPRGNPGTCHLHMVLFLRPLQTTPTVSHRVRQCNREWWRSRNARMDSSRERTAFAGESKPTYPTRSPSVMLIHVAVDHKGCEDTSHFDHSRQAKTTSTLCWPCTAAQESQSHMYLHYSNVFKQFDCVNFRS